MATYTEFPVWKQRRLMNLTLEEVAAAVGTSAPTLGKVEKGEKSVKKELARSIYSYYKGAVPLLAIYDPQRYLEEREALRHVG